MLEMYFNVLKDSNEIEHLINPIHYDNINKVLESVKAPDNPSLNEGWMSDCPLINYSFGIIPFVRHFPGRMVQNIKIKLNEEEFLIYAVDCSHLINGWYGVTIILTEKESMPITKELKLVSEFYKLVDKYNHDNFKDSLKELLGRYNSRDLSSILTDIMRAKRGYYNLEEVITPQKGCNTKWDFFICDESGAKLTDIFRYYDNTFFKLDMYRKYNLQGFGDKLLTEIHSLNCMGLSACHSTCMESGKLMGSNNARLRHVTTQLHNALGTGHTFLNEGLVGGANVLFVLDVKNKIPAQSKYVNKLFGNERGTLSLIKEAVSKGDSLDQEVIYKLVKKVVMDNEVT